MPQYRSERLTCVPRRYDGPDKRRHCHPFWSRSDGQSAQEAEAPPGPEEVPPGAEEAQLVAVGCPSCAHTPSLWSTAKLYFYPTPHTGDERSNNCIRGTVPQAIGKHTAV